jgi:hypothetical protein
MNNFVNKYELNWIELKIKNSENAPSFSETAQKKKSWCNCMDKTCHIAQTTPSADRVASFWICKIV